MLTFEPARQQDIAPLFLLNKGLIDRYEDVSVIDYDRVLRWVRQNIADTLPCFRRVICGGKVAGYFSLAPSEGKWELDSLFVLPEFQNKGIGTAILQYAIEESRGDLFFYVFKENTGARRLYERMGFRNVKEVRGTAYIMEYQKQG